MSITAGLARGASLLMVPPGWRTALERVRERINKPKVVVYTAVTDNYDVLPPPAMKVAGWSYLCFTDDLSISRPGWNLRALPQSNLDQIRRSRLAKILAHHFLSDYEISIWMDANLRIVGDLTKFYKLALAHSDLAFFRHGLRRPSVAAEIEACAQAGKAPHALMVRQYESYRGKGFPDDLGLIPEAGVIARRHQHPRVRAAMEEWWQELIAHTARDQISLPYIIWRNSLPITMLDWNLRESPWFSMEPHAA